MGSCCSSHADCPQQHRVRVPASDPPEADPALDDHPPKAQQSEPAAAQTVGGTPLPPGPDATPSPILRPASEPLIRSPAKVPPLSSPNEPTEAASEAVAQRAILERSFTLPPLERTYTNAHAWMDNVSVDARGSLSPKLSQQEEDEVRKRFVVDKEARLAARREATREKRLSNQKSKQGSPEKPAEKQADGDHTEQVNSMEQINSTDAKRQAIREALAQPSAEEAPSAEESGAEEESAALEQVAPIEQTQGLDDSHCLALEETQSAAEQGAAAEEAAAAESPAVTLKKGLRILTPEDPRPLPPPASTDCKPFSSGITQVQMPGVHMELSIANVTITNVDLEMPSNKPNQDRLLVSTALQQDPDQHFFGVFDGHGSTGHDCAQFAQQSVVEALCNSSEFKSKGSEWGLQTAHHSAMESVNEQMHLCKAVDDMMSGTTAITCLLRGTQLCVANVGDSRAILLRSTGVEGSWQAKDLSQDHTPFREDECERVRACGSQVKTIDELEGLCEPRAPSEWTTEDPPRCYVPFCGYPGTGFTRSLGDAVAKNIGVCAAPEVLVHHLTEIDQAFLLCSDGVTEFLTSQEIADILWEHKKDLLAAATILAKRAQKLWIDELAYTDDITVIVVQLHRKAASPVKETVEIPAALPTLARAYTSLRGDWYANPLVQLMDAKLMAKPPATPAGSLRIRPRRKDENTAALSLLASLSTNGLVRAESFRAPVDSMSLCLGSTRHVFPVLAKEKAQRVALRVALTSTPLCHRMSDEQVDDLVDVMELMPVKKSELVFMQGEQGEWFYVVENGSFGAFDANDQLIHQYARQEEGRVLPSFGEMSLLYGNVRPATVRALTEGASLWKLHKQAWLDQRKIGAFKVDLDEPALSPTLSISQDMGQLSGSLEKLPKSAEDLEQLEEATKRAPLLGKLEPSHRAHLFEAMSSLKLNAGEVLYKHGDKAEGMYVVQSGELNVFSTAAPDDDAGEALFYKYTTLSCFGEQALISNHKRCSTVTAQSDCVLWMLDYSSFKTTIKLLMSFGG